MLRYSAVSIYMLAAGLLVATGSCCKLNDDGTAWQASIQQAYNGISIRMPIQAMSRVTGSIMDSISNCGNQQMSTVLCDAAERCSIDVSWESPCKHNLHPSYTNFHPLVTGHSCSTNGNPAV
jgi:hypothetical protein